MKRVSKDRYGEVYRIMETSFPRDERRPEEDHLKCSEFPEYVIFCDEARNGDIAGFLAVWEYEELIYVEHFAVAEGFRNAGLGTSILERVQAEYRGRTMVLEVEPPVNRITERRVGFYERNGFVFNEGEYMQAPLGKDLDWVPLKLMSWPDALSDDEFERASELLHKTAARARE